MNELARWRRLPARERRVAVAAPAVLTVLTVLVHLRFPHRLRWTAAGAITIAGPDSAGWHVLARWPVALPPAA